MTVCPRPLLSVGELARRCDTSVHRVLYVVRKLQINPTARAGNAMVYTDEDATRIAAELKRIDEQKIASSTAAHFGVNVAQ